MTHPLHRILGTVLLAAAAGHAHAHVALLQKTAPAGSTLKAAFVVNQGCGVEPTKAIIVKLPDGIEKAQPMAKAGWLLTTRRVSGRVSEVAWRGGSLDAAHYDEFVIVLRVPDMPGKRYHFAVRQECDEAAIEWSDIPAEGKTARDIKTPAAELDVVPAAADDGSHIH